jgi:hypothetical protein
VDWAFAGLAGWVLIGVAVLGYYALSASNTTPKAPVIADNAPKTSVAKQSAPIEDLNQQSANTTASGDGSRKVRTINIRPAANMPAREPPVTAWPEPSASQDASVRSKVADANVPKAAIPSEPNTPAPRADTPVVGQKSVRTSAAPPQVTPRNGVIPCQTSAGRDGHWAWRTVDGKRCWYVGRAGMSKDRLQWVRSAG